MDAVEEKYNLYKHVHKLINTFFFLKKKNKYRLCVCVGGGGGGRRGDNSVTAWTELCYNFLII